MVTLNTDCLQISDMPGRGSVICRAWLHNTVFEWPPPERAWFVCTVIDLGETWAILDEAAWLGPYEDLVQYADSMAGMEGLCVTELRLARRSEIPDGDAATMSHVARGAEYVPVMKEE